MTIMSRVSRPLSGAAMALALATPLSLHAQTTPDPAPPPTAPADANAQSPTTAAPAAVSALSAICTDRPTRSNYACTVDAGHVQYESDLVNGSFLRLNGVTTDTYLLVNPTLKYGLTPDIDVEANLSPAEIVRTHDNFGDDHTIAGDERSLLEAQVQLPQRRRREPAGDHPALCQGADGAAGYRQRRGGGRR